MSGTGFRTYASACSLKLRPPSGALAGAFLGTHVPASYLGIIFGLILMQSAWQTSREHHSPKIPIPADPIASRLKLNGSYHVDKGGERSTASYDVNRVKTGFDPMF